ncbi:MAG: hypothetical protein ABR541_02550 [Candidatus Dormibacteria bacterium]
MSHLSEGTLRRLHDDPHAVTEGDHRHLDACARCRKQAAEIAADAERAGDLLALPSLAVGRPALRHWAVGHAPAGQPAVERAATNPPLSPAEVETALLRARSRLSAGAAPAPSPSPSWPAWRPRSQPSRRLVFAGAGLPVLLAALLVAVGASGWFRIFQPQQFAAVTVSTKELTGLPDLSSFGRMAVDRPQVSDATDAGAAARAAGLPVLTIPQLPAGVPSGVHWASVGRSSAHFTFDQAAARQAAQRDGQAAPLFPAGVNGSTVTVSGGPGVVGIFGTGSTSSVSSMPALVIAEARIPAVSTGGLTLGRLKDFLLAQPGVSAHLAAQVRAIGEPGSTLPIPFLIGQSGARQVDVNGSPGLEVGDATGLGAGVVWEHGGLVYAVGGAITDAQALAVARALH